jgi:hypothetical protein
MHDLHKYARSVNDRSRLCEHVEFIWCTRPKLVGEVQQLLEEAGAAGCHTEEMGSCQVLSPVRPSRRTQEALGAGEQVRA